MLLIERLGRECTVTCRVGARPDLRNRRSRQSLDRLTVRLCTRSTSGPRQSPIVGSTVVVGFVAWHRAIVPGLRTPESEGPPDVVADAPPPSPRPIGTRQGIARVLVPPRVRDPSAGLEIGRFIRSRTALLRRRCAPRRDRRARRVGEESERSEGDSSSGSDRRRCQWVVPAFGDGVVCPRSCLTW